MPKGRTFEPSRERDGIWFRHLGPKFRATGNGEEGEGVGKPPGVCPRNESTTTGKMQADPFSPATSYYPPDPPPKYFCLDLSKNDFSRHDNRHAFQGHGTYFGNGRDTRILGKKHGKTFEERPQFTEPDFLTHYSRIITECDYNTIYHDNYNGCPLSATEAKSFRRRFPRAYPEPSLCRNAFNEKGITRETSAPCRSTVETHVASLVPLPQDTGRWKYSYHGLPRAYPVLDKAAVGRRSSAIPAWHFQDRSGKVPCKFNVEG